MKMSFVASPEWRVVKTMEITEKTDEDFIDGVDTQLLPYRGLAT